MFTPSGERVIISRINMGKILGSNFFGSIRFYIIALIVMAAMIPSIFLSTVLLSRYETRAIDSRTTTIITQTQILADRLYTENYTDDPNDVFLNDEVDLLASYYDGRIMIINDACRVIYDSYGEDDEKIVISNGIFESLKGSQNSNYDSINDYIEICIPIMDSESNDVKGAVLVSSSTGEVKGNVSYLANWSLGFMVITVILVFIIAGFGASRLVKPFSVMSESIDKMQIDHENEELEILDYEETRQISSAFNEMLDRMKTLDGSRQEFVSNVSHELKTPLASMKVLCDSLLAQEDVPVEYYREFMQDIVSEVDRENEIINDLLSLVKLDKTSGVLNIDDVNINELVEFILKRLRPIADERRIEVLFESLRPVVAQVDEVKMTLVITNLIENAIKYNNDEGKVHVSLNADNEFFYLKVEDDGKGISKEDLGLIFERFYRGDKSHSKETSGTGLGLSIVRNAVLMHRGSVSVDSEIDQGSTFIVRIPLEHEVTEAEKKINEKKN